jgi:hypothetical protein
MLSRRRLAGDAKLFRTAANNKNAASRRINACRVAVG